MESKWRQIFRENFRKRFPFHVYKLGNHFFTQGAKEIEAEISTVIEEITNHRISLRDEINQMKVILSKSESIEMTTE